MSTKTISKLNKLFDDLNKRWSTDTCKTDAYQVYRQKEYRGTYDQLKDVDIESIALKILGDSVSEKVLIRLRALLQENIQIYETRQDDFSSIDFYKLYPLWEKYLFDDKRALLLKDKETIKNYPYPSERERKMLLEENQRDINELDNECYNLHRADSLWIGQNYYTKTYELSCSFLSILDNYFPVEKEEEKVEIKPVIKEGGYFDMSLIAPIHKVCNNIQFENLSEVDFYTLLNLQPANARLIVKTGERIRVCYLIHKLYEYLKVDNRTEWRTVILKKLEIKESLYNSKYKDAVSELPNRKSGNFVQQIDEIFEELS